jgi:DnaJ-domain-containing protein 1
MTELEDNIQQLEQRCHRLLCEAPAGLSEHTLLQSLRTAPDSLLPGLAPEDTLGLFQSHFLLFHALYRLRERLLREQSGVLQISPLCIRIAPYREGEAGLCQGDPLRDYYLDLSQLVQTGEEEVEAMLKGFWGRMGAADERLQALAVLGLEEPVDLATIKSRYRRLVMHHHPDRGGEAQRMQALNEAYTVLQRYYGP